MSGLEARTNAQLRNRIVPALKRRWLLAISAFAAVMIGLFWFFRSGIPVTTAAVTRGTAVEIVYATGAIEPVIWAKVTTIVKGRIVSRCRCEGKHVKAGDLLAQLDDVEAQASLRELRAREEFLRHDYERQLQLANRGVASEQTLQRAQSDLHQVQAQIAAQAERLVYYRIVAPMDGLVLREDGEVGEIVDSNTILYRIGNAFPLQLVAEVNEEDIPRVRVGQNVLLRSDAFASEQLAGTVREITPAGDTAAKTFRVRIALPEDTPLRVGMSVEANIVTNSKEDVLVVPAAALRGASVFIIERRRGVLHKVQIGIRGTQFVEVLSGLVEGDRVISPLPADLTNHQTVRVLNDSTVKK